MELSATPPRKGNNGRSLSTPKHRKRSPGDALGSGKSQLPITRFYSPISSSSDVSQPYSPVPSGSGVKRPISKDSKPRKILKAAPVSVDRVTIFVSSDDSSDDVFTQVQRTKLTSPVPKSRVNFPVKKRVYPVTPSPITSKSARTKKRPLKGNLRRAKFLDSDSEDEVPMDNSRRDSKPRRNIVPQSSQIAPVRTSTISTSKPHQNKAKPEAKRRLCLETLSQVVVITSSDDSDFELHNSKLANSFLSQSLCLNDATQSCHRGLLSSQTTRTSNVGRRSSVSSGGQIPVTNSTKDYSLKLNDVDALVDDKTAPCVLADDVGNSAIHLHSTLPTSNRTGNVVGWSSVGGSGQIPPMKSKDYCLKHNDVDKAASSVPAENVDGSAIYLQTTLPPSAVNDTSSLSDTDFPKDTGNTQPDTVMKPRQPVRTVTPGTTNIANRQVVFARPHPLISECSKDSNANNVNVSESINYDCSPETHDGDDQASSIYLHETVPLDLPHSTSIQTDASGTDHFTKNFVTSVTPGHSILSFRQSCVQDSQSHQAAETQSPPSGHAIYNEETIDPDNLEANLDLDSTDDGSHQPLTNGRSANASMEIFESPLPVHLSKGTIIEPSDEEDESSEIHDQSDNNRQVTENRTSLGIIPLSELLEVTHISGSDDSDFSDIVCSDDDVANHIGPPVEDSDDSSQGITSVMNSVLDASADFFSDVVSSFCSNDSDHDKESEKHDSCLDKSPTEGIVNIALAVAGIEKTSKSSIDENSIGIECERTDGHFRGGSGPRKDAECHKSGDRDESRISESTTSRKELIRPSLELNVSNCSRVVDDDNSAGNSSCNAASNVEEGTPLQQNGEPAELPRCSDTSKHAEAPLLVLQTGESAEESRCSVASQSVEASPVIQNGESAHMPQTCSTDGKQTDDVARFMNGSGYAASKIAVGESTDMTVANGESTEIKVVCGSLPPESLIRTSSLQIRYNSQHTLIHHPNKPLLLDAVITECQNYAGHVLNQEPIKTFVLQYSCLSKTPKLALHSGLLELIEDPKRWLKFGESSTGSIDIDTLVTSGIFKYLDKNDELFTKLNYLTYFELTDVLRKLGSPESNSIETMKSIILNWFSSAYTCERIKKEVTNLINRKFVKLTESADFCIKICLELFALPLNLCDKLYKTVDLARFANMLIRDDNKFLVLPLKMTNMVEDRERVMKDLGELCRLKLAVFGSDWKDESVYNQINDICSSIAVMEFSSESDPSVKTSMFRFLMTNYVHALDELLKFLTLCDSSDVDFGVCIYLGVLLKQNVTGSHLKVKWCRERMKRLAKLLDSSNVFDEFSKILKEPVSPVEFVVRSEFVSSLLKIKKLGLSPTEKTHLTQLLRPISHKKTHIAYLPLASYLNHYSVLTRKPKGKNFSLIRANIFEHYKSDFPSGVEDNGALLINAVYLTFWQAIYLKLDGVFVNKFQSCPLDWGSEEFFSKRQRCIDNLCQEMKKHGLSAVLKLIKLLFEQFYSHRCVVDWHLVSPNMSKMLSILEALGLEIFLKIAVYVLEKADERVLGFPEVVLWNPESKKVKFLGLKKPADPLYPHQILWLEKLTDYDVDAEELLVSGCAASEQCSQLK